jgi:hypothetical protein
MIELKSDKLIFTFPEVHKEAHLSIDFQRTLRIPDDDKEYFLPPGLGRFPLRHVDDCGRTVPKEWIDHGGVMFPMYQAEAMWIYCSSSYPFAIKVATGKINAVSGKKWKNGLNRSPQDYVVAPTQPWLDGYCIEKGVIRQFVAMPLGAGFTAEEQLTGNAKYGGLQIVAYPMKEEAYNQYLLSKNDNIRAKWNNIHIHIMDSMAPPMGLAPGGRMRQEIYEDPHKADVWDTGHYSRCFVHICNSLVWKQVTGQAPPTKPPTSKNYTDAGLPWFDYYNEKATALSGSSELAGLKSVYEKFNKLGLDLPDNESVHTSSVVKLRQGLKRDQVQEWGGKVDK